MEDQSVLLGEQECLGIAALDVWVHGCMRVRGLRAITGWKPMPLT